MTWIDCVSCFCWTEEVRPTAFVLCGGVRVDRKWFKSGSSSPHSPNTCAVMSLWATELTDDDYDAPRCTHCHCAASTWRPLKSGGEHAVFGAFNDEVRSLYNRISIQFQMWFGSDLHKSGFMWFSAVQTVKFSSGYSLNLSEIWFGPLAVCTRPSPKILTWVKRAAAALINPNMSVSSSSCSSRFCEQLCFSFQCALKQRRAEGSLCAMRAAHLKCR